MESISNAEWEIMRVIWTKEETTSTEISQVLGEKLNWKPSTIKTLLTRLVDKGYAVTKRDGKRFIYSSLVSEKEAFSLEMKSLLTKICNRQVVDVLSDVIAEQVLSQTDIERLMTQLIDKQQNAPSSVPCQCIPGQCRCH
ncbi:CopY/TcrY family copper transport repressor [Vagococcus penaei]|nr:CopY/TcrY family copper transport repressor [Vagococcus penaei]